MNHHAFYVTGDIEEGVKTALTYGTQELGLTPAGNPDVMVLRYGLFPVEEARKITELASRMPAKGEKKLIIIAAARLFHESQNALLKVFEEPLPGTTLVLIVPSEGVIIPTLRSRLLPLPGKASGAGSELARAFLKGNSAEREKIIAKLLDRAKSDKPEEKQQARTDALALANGLARAAYAARHPKTDMIYHISSTEKERDMDAFLRDLDRFIPILHERSAPLKPIFEHLLITIPASIDKQ